jgi:hypothetical protein
MVELTRRTLLRAGSAAAGAAPLSLLFSASDVNAQGGDAGTVFHIFAFQWKPGTTDEQIAKATHDIKAFQGTIPGLLQTHVGPNISPRGKGYTFGGLMQFKDQAALDAYVQHPSHQALLKWLVPLIDAIELDLRA